MVATLLIFCLMIDGGTTILYLHLACRPVTLEILHIGSRIPQTPLCKGEQFQRLNTVGSILQRQFLYLSPCLQGDEEQHRGLYPILGTSNTGIVHAMTTLIRVERRLTGFPTWIPYRLAILDIEIATTGIHRHAIIAIAYDAAELGILIEVVATGGI